MRFFVVGKTCDGLTLGMRKTLPTEKRQDPCEFTYGVINGIENLEHLSDCTGWDWEAPAEPPSNQDLFEMIVHLRDQMASLVKRVENIA